MEPFSSHAEKIYQWDGDEIPNLVFANPTTLGSECDAGTDIYIYHAPTGLHLMTPHGPQIIIPKSVLGKCLGDVAGKKFRTGTCWSLHRDCFNYSDGQLIPLCNRGVGVHSPQPLDHSNQTSRWPHRSGHLLGRHCHCHNSRRRHRSNPESEKGRPARQFYFVVVRRSGTADLWVTSDFKIFKISLNSPSTIFNQAEWIKEAADHQNRT